MQEGGDDEVGEQEDGEIEDPVCKRHLPKCSNIANLSSKMCLETAESWVIRARGLKEHLRCRSPLDVHEDF